MKVQVFLFIQFLDAMTFRDVSFGGKIQNGADILPWVGILRWNVDKRRREAATGIILVGNDMALGSAVDISKIDKKSTRNTTTAMFLKQYNIPWYRKVNDYILHPEFESTTTNTVALLLLEPQKNDSYFRTISFYWPVQSHLYEQNIFTVGLTDEQQIMEQVMYKVAPLNKSECKEFYKREQLDFQSLWPTNYQCYKNANTNRTCLSERGLALAYNASGRWIPIGISTYGPGCSLPCRYIELVAYTEWIRSKKKLMRPVKSIRRFYSFVNLTQGTDYKTQWDLDSSIFRLIHSNEPSELFANFKYHDAECEYNIDDVLVYSESGYIITKSSLPVTAIFAVTLFDLNVESIYCIEVDVNATASTKVKKFYNYGVEQDDISPYIKQLPIIPDGETEVGSKVLHMVDRPFGFLRIETANIFYRFMFTGRADINVRFYGRPFEKTLESEELGDSSSSTRKPRVYSTHIRPG